MIRSENEKLVREERGTSQDEVGRKGRYFRVRRSDSVTE